MFEKHTYRKGVNANAGEGAENSHISGTVSTTTAALEEQLRLVKLETKLLGMLINKIIIEFIVVMLNS